VRLAPRESGRGRQEAAPGRCPAGTGRTVHEPARQPVRQPARQPARPATELAAATARHATWAVDRGLLTRAELPRYQAYALPELIGHAYPRTRGADLDLLIDVLGWFTILDDRFDGSPGRRPVEARAVVDPLIAVLDDPAPAEPALFSGDDLLTAAWRELWHRQTETASPAWRARAAHEWRACLATFPAEAQHRAHGTVPRLGLAETMRLRRHGSCLYPFMNILERVHGTDAPAALHADPALHRLRAHTADAATLINDLYSLQREERQGAAAFNTVLTLQRLRACTRTRAVGAVRARVAHLRNESALLRHELLRRHPEADWYLDGTRELVDGAQAWTSTSRRYH
ncbi:terpene synthase family protein, partial [Kitasatospora sp. NPDC093558]|uniref:terpene synthase family protein n=1 Tax=Kitasatospora sp. NPDC093558 TaxID=3155201 RepID=UPI00342EA06B